MLNISVRAQMPPKMQDELCNMIKTMWNYASITAVNLSLTQFSLILDQNFMSLANIYLINSLGKEEERTQKIKKRSKVFFDSSVTTHKFAVYYYQMRGKNWTLCQGPFMMSLPSCIVGSHSHVVQLTNWLGRPKSTSPQLSLLHLQPTSEY